MLLKVVLLRVGEQQKGELDRIVPYIKDFLQIRKKRRSTYAKTFPARSRQRVKTECSNF